MKRTAEHNTEDREEKRSESRKLLWKDRIYVKEKLKKTLAENSEDRPFLHSETKHLYTDG